MILNGHIMAIFVSFTAFGWKCFLWREDRHSCSFLVSIDLIFIFKLRTFSLYMSSKFKFWLENLIHVIHANIFLLFCYYLLVFCIVYLSNFSFVWGMGYFSVMLRFNSLHILWVHSSKLCLFSWWLLSLTWFEYRIPLAISCRFGLIVMTSLKISYPEKALFSLFLKRIFLGTALVERFIISVFECTSHSLLVCKISAKKSETPNEQFLCNNAFALMLF